jgi:beta-galactosidase
MSENAAITRFPATKPDWSNLEVIHRNTLDPRSYFFLFESEQEALSGDTRKSTSLCLSGKWKFSHANSPFEAVEGFEAPSFDSSKWRDIEVPGHWQLQGWVRTFICSLFPATVPIAARGKYWIWTDPSWNQGSPHYTNLNYPFFIDPPNAPFDDNQTGSYVRRFEVPASFEGQQLRLRFEGVDSAFHVYVNDAEVGYSQGSRNPSEFDITSLVQPCAENVLAVRVYQYCDGKTPTLYPYA